MSCKVCEDQSDLRAIGDRMQMTAPRTPTNQIILQNGYNEMNQTIVDAGRDGLTHSN